MVQKLMKPLMSHSKDFAEVCEKDVCVTLCRSGFLLFKEFNRICWRVTSGFRLIKFNLFYIVRIEVYFLKYESKILIIG